MCDEITGGSFKEIKKYEPMSEEYKNKLKAKGLDVEKLPVESLWTSSDGRWVTPVFFDKTIFTEIKESGAGTVSTIIDIMNTRITERYGLVPGEFEIFNYFGDGLMNGIKAVVLVDKESVGKVMLQNDAWCN